MSEQQVDKALIEQASNGDKEAFEALQPCFEVIGHEDKLVYHGPAGNGQRCKAVNQTMIASIMFGVCDQHVDDF